ncbi:MAG: hypothetical protein HY696_08260 [Deltaproteobacteria bacterium]|nr:hypothetical protein [Deltaproteobacteria bacterium]
MQKGRKRRWLLGLGLAVAVFFGMSLTIHWSDDACPARSYLATDWFPVTPAAVDMQSANAVAQWARKYNVACQTCHTAFPRLNYIGEKFARNGYQFEDTEDGDDTKEKIDDLTFIDKVSNLFGFRISFTPVEVTTKALNIDGTQKLRYNFGAANWLQFFVAGTIFKNASIFAEVEMNGENGTTYSTAGVPHINWFTLGYHNLFHTSLLNIRLGKLSMMNWHAQTGRLRMIPNINIAATNARTSLGAAAALAPEDQIRLESPTPAIEVYGYKGFFQYSVGVANGSKFVDSNQYKNFFGTLRFEIPDGDFAGSSVTAWGMHGRDTAVSGAETPAVAQVKNTFYAYSGAANLRWKDLDVIASYFMEKERNYDFAGAQNKRHGFSGQVGYLLNPQWFLALQYDKVQDTANSGAEYHKVSEHVSYMPRQNMRIGLTAREEMSARATGRQHELLLNIRAMF